MTYRRNGCQTGAKGDEANRGGIARRRRVVAWLAGLVTVLACGDGFDRLLSPVALRPTRVELVDFRTGPLLEPSAFDGVNGRVVRVDQTVGWDFLFFLPEDGPAELRAFEAVTGELSEASLQKVELAFDDITLAPEEGYVRTEPVPVSEGDVLVFTTRRDPAFQGLRCRHFGKLEVLEIDRPAGRLAFHFLLNPNCEVRGLVPGETGSFDE